MSKSFKWGALLAVALPLWFIAWRTFEEWRTESAWREFRSNMRLQWEFHNQGKADETPKAVVDRTNYLLEKYKESWLVRGYPNPNTSTYRQ